MHFLTPLLHCSDLWLMVVFSISLTPGAEAFYYGNGMQQMPPPQQFPQQPPTPTFGRQQLVIYDPFTGRQMLPFQYLPIAFNTNNNNDDVERPKPLMVTGNLVELPKLWNPCSCTDYTCMCCVGLGFGGTYRDRVCVSLAYNAAQVALQLRIDHNQFTIANFGFPVRNPPDYCVPLLLPLPVFSCLRLYDVRTTIDGNVQICMSVALKVFTNQIFEYHFDCVRFGGSGIYFVKSTQNDSEDDSTEHEDVLLSANVRPLQKRKQQQQQQQANDKINADDFLRL